MSRKFSNTKQKVLLLLLGGLALGCTRSPGRYFKIVGQIQREWREIERCALQEAIGDLYRSKLVDVREHKDGSATFVLTDKGKQKTLKFKIDDMQIQHPRQWDGKWRIVMFDVPEEKKSARDALRFSLRKLGFCELQKSVFVHPFPCSDETEFLIEFYQLRPHVRQIMAEYIDTELHLKEKFNLRK